MELQVLPPTVQDAEEANLGPKPLRVGSYFEQSVGGCAEQQTVDGLLIVEREPGQLMWQREDHVEVADRQCRDPQELYEMSARYPHREQPSM